jgi:hypothetical protein
MKTIQSFRRAASAGVALAGSVLGFVLFAPAAFGVVARPVGGGPSSALLPQTSPATGHAIVTGSLSSWEVALIAAGAALVTATIAVFADRARGSHRRMTASAA